MRTWQLDNIGKQNLTLNEVRRPEPGVGEVLIRTKAVSLNYRDKAIIDGSYPLPMTFPMVPTSDLAGEVVAVGPQVQQLRPGDKVISVYKPFWIDGVPSQDANAQNLGGPLAGTLSEYVLLPESGALTYPKYLTPRQASTLPIAAVSAWVGLFAHGDLQSGQTVLVQGSGGVALAALQLAVAQGATVFALSRSDEKAGRMKELGVTEVINTNRNPSWELEIRRLTDAKGVDHVVEVLGGAQLQRSIAASAWGGHISLVGFMEQQNAEIFVPAILGSALRIQGIGVGSRKDTQDLLGFLENHPIQPVIEASYGFEEAPKAFDHLDRGPFGKVVIEFGD